MPYITGLHNSGAANSVSTNAEVSGLSGGASSLPVGSVVPFVGTSIPSGMLLCDGSAVSRTTYSSLFTIIGTSFGSGDGSTTFNVPNFRTGNRIPIGKNSSVAAIDTLGKSGGSFNHTHTSTAHAHSFTHNHDMGNHTHAYDHSHTMGNHTHTTSHYHSLGNHYHTWGAHGHAAFSISATSNNNSAHTHTYTTCNTTSSTSGGTAGPRQASTGATNYYNTSTDSQTVGAATLSIGTGGTDMSVNAIASGSPRWNDGVSNRDYVTSTNNTSGAPSTNNTGSATGSTGAPSTNNVDNYTGNTDSGGGSLTTSTSNPPYVSVNFIIQAQ